MFFVVLLCIFCENYNTTTNIYIKQLKGLVVCGVQAASP